MGCEFRTCNLFYFKGGIVNKELKIARIISGFSQHELSRLTGISQSDAFLSLGKNPIKYTGCN